MKRLSGLLEVWLGVLGYIVAAGLLTYPLPLHVGDSVISHWNDIEHSLWIQWWFKKALETPALSLFSTNMIHFPYTVNLQFADINLAVNFPLFLLQHFLPLYVVYNLSIWISFVLSASLMWWFAGKISGNRLAGWMGGLLFAGSTYWISSMMNGWLYLVHIWVFPLTFLALMHARDRRSLGSAALAGLAWGLSFHVSPYYFIFLSLLSTPFVLWQLIDWIRQGAGRRAVLSLAAFSATILIVILPRVWPMALSSGETYCVHHSSMNTELSASLSEMLVPSWAAVTMGSWDQGYRVVYLGYTAMAMLLLGWLISDRRRAYLPWLISGSCMVLLALGPLVQIGWFPPFKEMRFPLFYINRIPGFGFMTNHWRWMLPASFCFFSAAALGLADVVKRVQTLAPGRTIPVFLIFLVFYIVEAGWVYPFPLEKPLWTVTPAPVAYVLKQEEGVHAVWDIGPHSKLNQTIHEKAILDGWLPRAPLEPFKKSRFLIKKCRSLSSPDKQARFLLHRGVNAVLVNQEKVIILRRDPLGKNGIIPRTVQVKPGQMASL